MGQIVVVVVRLHDRVIDCRILLIEPGDMSPFVSRREAKSTQVEQSTVPPFLSRFPLPNPRTVRAWIPAVYGLRKLIVGRGAIFVLRDLLHELAAASDSQGNTEQKNNSVYRLGVLSALALLRRITAKTTPPITAPPAARPSGRWNYRRRSAVRVFRA